MKVSTVVSAIIGLLVITFSTTACTPVSVANALIQTCPTQAINDMNAEFGVGTSNITTCLQNAKELKMVIAWNSPAVNKRSGAGQQPHSTRQMIQNYTTMYNLSASKHHEMLIVGYGAGGRWLLTDEAYNRTYGVTTGNPTRAVMDALLIDGITMYMCQNTMRGNGWTTQDLIPGVEMVPAGVVAVVDFESLGYLYVAP